MEYGLIFQGTRTGKYCCKNMKIRINIYILAKRARHSQVCSIENRGYIHSIPSYPDTLGPGTARISDIPVTQNRTHILQITCLSPTSRWESPLSSSFNTSSFFSRVKTVRFQSKNCPFSLTNSGRLHFNSKSSNQESFTAAKDRRIYRGR